MIRVLKYSFEGNSEVSVPIEARPIHVADQPIGSNRLHVWCEVPDPARSKLTKTIRIIGTGREVPPMSKHIGSVVCMEGTFVWHIYEGFE